MSVTKLQEKFLEAYPDKKLPARYKNDKLWLENKILKADLERVQEDKEESSDDGSALKKTPESVEVEYKEEVDSSAHLAIAAKFLNVDSEEINVHGDEKWGGFSVKRKLEDGTYKEQYEVLKVQNHSYTGKVCFRTCEYEKRTAANGNMAQFPVNLFYVYLTKSEKIND